MEEKKINILLIDKKGKQQAQEKEIIDSINGYLIRNKGAVGDFNLITENTERNVENLEEEVNSLLPIPLYLGLAGTMLGIIIGLFALPSVGSDNFEHAIDILISGVKIAMIASFSGLILTVISSGYFFKTAKLKVDKSKNHFYTFIQTELLPVVSQTLASSLRDMHLGLSDFNRKFGENVKDFNESLTYVKETFDAQTNLTKQIQEMDFVELSKHNLVVLAEIRESMKHFQGFNNNFHQLNDYLTNIKTFIDSAKSLNSNISNQLDRTIMIEGIANEIGKSIDDNHKVVEFLNEQNNEIKERRDIVSSTVGKIDDAMIDAFSQLEESINNQIKKINDLTIKEEDLMIDLLKEKKGNLDELKKLSSMNSGIEKVIEKIDAQGKSIDNLANVLKSNSKNTEQNNSLTSYKFKNIPLYAKIGFITITSGGAAFVMTLLYKLFLNLFF